jgi:hypothetical protein
MPYAKTSQRAEQRALREKMRLLGLSHRQIAVEFGRRYQLRSRAAWRHAHGWSLTEAAEQITSYAGKSGLGDGSTVAMNSSHLCEVEGWPGQGGEPSGRRPTPYLLSLLSEVYGCTAADLLDLADYEHMRPADRLVLDRVGQHGHQREAGAVIPFAGQAAETDISAAARPFSSPTAANTADPPPIATGDSDAFGAMVHANWPGVRLSRPCPGYGVDWQAELPGGRELDGGGTLGICVRPVAGAAGESVWLSGTSPLGEVRAARRGVAAGVEHGDGTVRVYAARLSRGHQRAAAAANGAGLGIPRAYELDDLTYALIWAVANLDDALLSDDYALDQRQRELRAFAHAPYSVTSGDEAVDLTSAARMWLGSSACARYVLRQLARPTGVPVFWTREQRGEEACAWLLFRHKYDYLRRLSAQFAGSAAGLTRGFCVPQTSVATSPRWERTLMFLAVALMESLGIRTQLCAEPEYADMDGFALLPGEQAIIATWVRSGGTCRTATTSSSATLRQLGDVAGHAAAHSVIQADNPGHRLEALADYLGLDWPWLRGRCAALGTQGCAGLIRPASRLLCLDAMDTALRYAGAAGRDS